MLCTYCITFAGEWLAKLIAQHSLWILSEAAAAVGKWMQILVSLPLCGVIAMELWGWVGFKSDNTHAESHWVFSTVTLKDI